MKVFEVLTHHKKKHHHGASQPCPHCNGFGLVSLYGFNGHDADDNQPCPHCDGSGVDADDASGTAMDAGASVGADAGGAAAGGEQEEDSESEMELCGHCNGTGEGQYPGTRCGSCKGSGVIDNREPEDDRSGPWEDYDDGEGGSWATRNS